MATRSLLSASGIVTRGITRAEKLTRSDQSIALKFERRSPPSWKADARHLHCDKRNMVFRPMLTHSDSAIQREAVTMASQFHLRLLTKGGLPLKYRDRCKSFRDVPDLPAIAWGRDLVHWRQENKLQALQDDGKGSKAAHAPSRDPR